MLKADDDLIKSSSTGVPVVAKPTGSPLLKLLTEHLLKQSIERTIAKS
jgi:hypothetical protein